jgi:ribosomal protein S12 methylthiotransferase
VGYPGETDEIFNQLKKWVSDTKFDRLGVFTYSHEENTSAHDLVDDVPDSIKKKRAEEIMDLQTNISWDLNQKKIGKTLKVLFDRKEGDYFIGRSEFDSPDVDNEILVKADNTYIRIGDFARVKVEKTDHFDLYGVVDV